MTRRVLAFTAYLIAASAALVASGCVCEDYYCDESGCYFCDGIGCRAVDPPARPDCDGDFECGSSTMCTNLGCTSMCETDGDCPQGTHCDQGLCVNPTEGRPTPRPGMCTRNSECDPDGDGDAACVDGKCQRRMESRGCEENDECESGQVCRAGECVDEEDACQFNYECGEGKVCADGACTTECDAARPCASGFACTDGVCVEMPATGQCTNNAACGEGKVCIDSTCYDSCTTDATCGMGRYCADGVCRVDNRPQRFCSSDADCRPGHTCDLEHDICRTPCETHNDCLRFDVQFNVCQERFCVTTNEATAECLTSPDCSSGKTCLDGICR